MNYRYRELSESELRELAPGAEVYVLRHDQWEGPKVFREYDPGGMYPVIVEVDADLAFSWSHAAIREPVEQRITMDRAWQTRDGRAFVPYCIDAPAPYAVHGRLEGESIPRAWRKNGRSPDKRELDLIPAPDWREQIPWEWFEPWVQWVACSGDDKVWRAYEYSPVQMERRWADKRGRAFILSAIRMPEGPKNWREAIAQRPENNNAF